MDKGRHVNSMDRNVGVCFSSDSSLAEGALQDQGGAVGSPSRGATVAQTGMVSRPPRVKRIPQAAVTARVKHFPSESSDPSVKIIISLWKGIRD